MMNFAVETFIDQCLHAAHESDEPLKALSKVMTCAVRDPSCVAKILPPEGDDEILLYRSDNLSIYRVLVYHGLQYPPHEHGIPVVIGAYAGYETNVLYARTASDPSRIQSIGLLNMSASQVRTLRGESIHAVTNGRFEAAAALHVYLGDLSQQKRSLWTLEGDGECPFTIEDYRRRARQPSMSIVA